MTGEQFLEQHNISEQFALEYGVAWDDNHLHIPIKDEDGKLLFLKSRNLNYGEGDNKEPKYKNPVGSIATLFNWHNAKNAPNIVLCEGEADALKLTEVGIPAISTSGGAGTFKQEWVEMLKDKGIYICYDNDDAGHNAVRKLLPLFPSVRVIELPQQYKDICDYFYAGHTKKDFFNLGSVGSEEWYQRHRKHKVTTARKLDKKVFPEQKWLIENVVYAEGFCFIYGAEGTGKSYLTLDMAKAIATGEPWLGKFKTTKAKVLFIDKENPESLIQERLRGLGMTEKEIDDAVDNLYWIEQPELYQLTNEKGEASEFALELGQIIEEEEIDLIVVDSFVDLVVGSENSSADTQAFFSALRELYPTVAYLVLHHENKPTQGVTRSSSQRLRGSSNINAQTFTMFRLEPVAKSKTEMTLQQTKARNTQKLSKFMIRMKITPQVSGGSVVSGFEYLGEVEDAVDTDPTKTSEIQEAIKNAIETRGFVSRQDIIDMGKDMGVHRATVDRGLRSLVESGEIMMKKEGRKNIYVIVSDMFSEENMQETLDELSRPLV